MGREVRMVPADWQHPTNGTYSDGEIRYVPLFGRSFAKALAEWDLENQKWEEGLRSDYNGGWKPIGDVDASDYASWAGERPVIDDYMPDWPAEQRTHFMMYEDTSEGTPISPAFATGEELARWLADTNASAFGNDGATYEQWLSMINRGWAPSAIMTGGTIQSGVAGLTA